MSNQYKVISLNFTKECNLNCPICYRSGKSEKPKDLQFFIDMIPYLAKLTKQVALGGGEPLLFQDFVYKFSKEAKKYNLYVNITTNGSIKPLKSTLKYLHMISISFDRYKIKNLNNLSNFKNLVSYFKNNNKLVGANFLIDDNLDLNREFFTIIDFLESLKLDYIYLLLIKNYKSPDVLKKLKLNIKAVSELYNNIFIDNLLNTILINNSYTNWKRPCGFGIDEISIDENGYVYGCSFDDKPILKLDKPSDILKLRDISMGRRYSCPYLKI